MNLHSNPPNIFEVQARQAILRAWGNGLQTEKLITAAEWAEKYRVLSSETSAEPGPYRLSRTPYVREPLECLSVSSPVREVVLMWGSQLSKSETGNNWLGYLMHNAPGPILMVQPSDGLADEYSKDRIDPLINETEVLKNIVAESGKKDGGNTVRRKEFPGGNMKITGAQVAKGLASKPVRYLFLDEVDRYPGEVDGEGDPIALAEVRQTSFGVRAKTLITSTPTIDGLSKVQKRFLASDQRHFYLHCPHCNHPHVLEMRNLKWASGKPHTAEMMCPSCGAMYQEHNKTEMLLNGMWKAHNPNILTKAGFYLSSLYSPVGWYSWGMMAEEFLSARKDPAKLKTFTNTREAKTWKEKGEAPDHQRLYERRETFERAVCPENAYVLTAGVDVQQDRIESRVYAWAENEESWLIDHRIFEGKPTEQEVWDKLWAHREEKYKHALGGEVPISMMAVDTGYETHEVYYQCGKQTPGTVMMVDGMDHLKAPVGSPRSRDINRAGKRQSRAVMVYPVGSNFLKEKLYAQLRLDMPEDGKPYPRGYIHLPTWIDQEECKQLTAEQLIMKKNKRGYSKYEWDKHRDRNEGLDCRNYSYSAYDLLGCPRWSSERWQQEKRKVMNIPAPPKPKQDSYLNRNRKKKQGSWIKR